MPYSIMNSKNQYWQIGQWVNHLADATKYESEELAYMVIGTQPRRFHSCSVEENPNPIVPAPIAEMTREFPYREVAECPYGLSLYGFDPTFPYPGNK